MNKPYINNLDQLEPNRSVAFLIGKGNDELKVLSNELSPDELKFVESKEDENFPLAINQYNRFVIIGLIPEEKTEYKNAEALRLLGYKIHGLCKSQQIKSLQIVGNAGAEIFVSEGLTLSSYDFVKYKTENSNNLDMTLSFVNGDKAGAEEISNLSQALFFARDMVNEPQSYLNAVKYSEELERQCTENGISYTCLDFDKIKELKMGGLLAVNRGSLVPPTFNIMEYKPSNAVNSQPLVLVGKGVVYDTGGLSLKPTPHSMDIMKCDMGGSAAVAGAIIAIAKNKLPYHVITLIPATDNRPGGDAYAPGDVLTMYNGSTVEVWNTDAEGRLVLADALTYAKQYNPHLVIDVATLTGSAMRAIGKEATVMMGTASEQIKGNLKDSGNATYERLVEFPLWDEYKSSLESDIADIRNLGEPNAGAITAGKFLETFTDYPWMHLDIAAPAFLDKEDKYRGKNGTGVGVRLIYDFVKKLSNG